MNDDNTKLVAGMMVYVYEDPITCKKLEGRAKLIRPANGDSRWVVAFPEDGQYHVERAINPATAHQVLG